MARSTRASIPAGLYTWSWCSLDGWQWTPRGFGIILLRCFLSATLCLVHKTRGKQTVYKLRARVLSVSSQSDNGATGLEVIGTNSNSPNVIEMSRFETSDGYGRVLGARAAHYQSNSIRNNN